MGVLGEMISGYNSEAKKIQLQTVNELAQKAKADAISHSMHLELLGPSYGFEVNFKIAGASDCDWCVQYLSDMARQLKVNFQVNGNLFTFNFNDLLLASSFRKGWSNQT